MRKSAVSVHMCDVVPSWIRFSDTQGSRNSDLADLPKRCPQSAPGQLSCTFLSRMSSHWCLIITESSNSKRHRRGPNIYQASCYPLQILQNSCKKFSGTLGTENRMDVSRKTGYFTQACQLQDIPHLCGFQGFMLQNHSTKAIVYIFNGLTRIMGHKINIQKKLSRGEYVSRSTSQQRRSIWLQNPAASFIIVFLKMRSIKTHFSYNESCAYVW